MLEDEALAEGAYHAIAAGVAADRAWRSALEAEIAGYATAEDEYFRARAADLADIRDRVLAHLTGARQGRMPTARSCRGRYLAVPLSRHRLGAWRDRASRRIAFLACGDAGARARRAHGGRPRRIVVEPAAAGWRSSTAIRARDLRSRAGDTRRSRAAWRLRTPRAPWPTPTARACVHGRRRRIAVLLNIAAPEELAGLDPAICDGIGLVRTEFLFEAARGLPDEDAQYAVYRRILEWAGDGR